MILCDKSIKEMIDKGLIVKNPRDGLYEQVNANSIDLTIGKDLLFPNPGGTFLETSLDSLGRDIYPGQTLLAATNEVILMPRNLCGQIFTKSSWGRVFLNHMMAGVIDAGFIGTITLELKNEGNQVVKIHPNERIVQMIFMQLNRPAEADYRDRKSSKYMYQDGPTPAKWTID